MGHGHGAGQVLYKATPLLFAGVAVDVAMRGKLFNIGGEGQLAVASLATLIGLVHSPLPGGALFWPWAPDAPRALALPLAGAYGVLAVLVTMLASVGVPHIALSTQGDWLRPLAAFLSRSDRR